MADIGKSRLYPKLYCLSLVAYFERIPSAMPTLMSECLGLACKLYGNASATFWFAGRDFTDSECTSLGGRRDRYAGIRLRRRLEEHQDLRILSGIEKPRVVVVSYPRDSNRYSDYGLKVDSFAVEFDADPVVHGFPVGPYLRMDINVEQLNAEKKPAIADVAVQFGAAVARTNVLCSGMCDVADLYETAMGRYYSCVTIGWVNFQRQMARMIWARCGDERRGLSSGVYWGNLFGPAMVNKLRGESFSSDFCAMEGGSDCDLYRTYPDGSALVMISSTPLNCVYPFTGLLPPVLERAAWLYERLCIAGLMCGMAKQKTSYTQSSEK